MNQILQYVLWHMVLEMYILFCILNLLELAEVDLWYGSSCFHSLFDKLQDLKDYENFNKIETDIKIIAEEIKCKLRKRQFDVFQSFKTMLFLYLIQEDLYF